MHLSSGRCRAIVASLLFFAIAMKKEHLAQADSQPQPVLLDKIVAVIEDKTIYRSDVIERAHPFLARVVDKNAGTMTKLYREVLDTMIDELVIAAQVEQLKLQVTDDEVEKAIAMIAQNASITKEQLVAEVKKQSMTMDEYRREVRRQILDAKWVQLRVRNRVKAPTTGTDAEKERVFTTALEVERRKMLTQLRGTMYVDIRW